MRTYKETYKDILILVDSLVTLPCMIVGFIFELIRLGFMHGRERYVKYLIWLVEERRKL